jgi:hypothetical protein
MWRGLLFKVQSEGGGASLVLAARAYKVERKEREEEAASKLQVRI